MYFFLVTPCLVVAVQLCMEWIPIKKNITEKWRNKIKYPGWNSIRLEFEGDQKTYWVLPKALNIGGATARVERLSEVLVILSDVSVLSDITVRRSAVEWEDLIPLWKKGKKPYFWTWSTSGIVQKHLRYSKPFEQTEKWWHFLH